MTNVNQTNKTNATANEESYAEELGTIVFQSALMRYLVEGDEEKASIFNAFIESHIEKNSFLDDLCDEYPEFEKLLREEMQLLQKELIDVVPN